MTEPNIGEPDLRLDGLDDGLCGYGKGSADRPACNNPATVVIVWNRRDENGEHMHSNSCMDHISIAIEKYDKHIYGIVGVITKGG